MNLNRTSAVSLMCAAAAVALVAVVNGQTRPMLYIGESQKGKIWRVIYRGK